MIKDAIGILELIIIAHFTLKVARRLLFGKKKKYRRTTVSRKIQLLISRQLHSIVDNMLDRQTKKLAENTQQVGEKVINFKQYKRQSN